MDEYIKNSDVKKAFLHGFTDRKKYPEFVKWIAESAERIVNDMPSADVQPVDRWISVNDRLPDVAEAEVLVWIDDGTADGIKIYNSLHIAYWYGDTKLFYDFHCDEIKGVTHWMYVSAIPEPTKDGDAE